MPMRTSKKIHVKLLTVLNTCAREKVEIAAFHEGILYGYTNCPDFWSSLDQTRIERAERQIIQVCREKGIAAIVGSTHLENGATLQQPARHRSRWQNTRDVMAKYIWRVNNGVNPRNTCQFTTCAVYPVVF